MKMYEYIHHLDSRIGRSEIIFLVRFGARSFSQTELLDKGNKKSLYYKDLSKKRP
jgi:hypothetical protein